MDKGEGEIAHYYSSDNDSLAPLHFSAENCLRENSTFLFLINLSSPRSQSDTLFLLCNIQMFVEHNNSTCECGYATVKANK